MGRFKPETGEKSIGLLIVRLGTPRTLERGGEREGVWGCTSVKALDPLILLVEMRVASVRMKR